MIPLLATARLALVLPGLFAAVLPGQMLDAEKIYDPAHLVDVRIEIAAKDWSELRRQTRSFAGSLKKVRDPSPYTYFKATVTIDGVRIENVGIRKKGLIGSQDGTRPSLKIKLQAFGKRKRLPTRGFDRLTLNNNKQDPSQASQVLSYKLFRDAGNPAPRCNHAKVTVNGTSLGIYSNVEAIKPTMLAREFGDGTGALFEGTVADFFIDAVDRFETKNKAATTASLMPLAEACTRPEFDLGSVAKHIDIDAFLQFWATESLIGFWDGYTNNQNNFFVYRKPANGRLYFIPWGTDSSFVAKMPIEPYIIKTKSAHSQAILPNRLYRLPEIQTRYRKTLETVMAKIWDEAALNRELDRIQALVQDHLHPRQGDFTGSMKRMRNFIRTRQRVIDRELKRWPLKLKTGPRSPFYCETFGTGSATFATRWTESAPQNPVTNGKVKLALSIQGKPVELEWMGISAQPSTWPTPDGGPKPPSITLTGKRTTDGEILIVAFAVTIDDFRAAPDTTVPVMGAFIEGRFGFLNPKKIKLFSGLVQLSAAEAKPGAEVRGEVTFEIAEMLGGTPANFSPK